MQAWATQVRWCTVPPWPQRVAQSRPAPGIKDVSAPERRRPHARSARFTVRRDQSLFAFSFIAASSFLMSAGDSCGRSTLIVSLLSLAVSGNGGL